MLGQFCALLDLFLMSTPLETTLPLSVKFKLRLFLLLKSRVKDTFFFNLTWQLSVRGKDKV